MARQVEHLIVENGWNHADPAMVFSDTYERFQPVSSEKYGPRLSNACSEYVQSAGGSCNLISVNVRLAADEVEMDPFEFDDEWFRSGYEAIDDWKKLRGTASFAQYLDGVAHAARLAYRHISAALGYNVAPTEFIHHMTSEHFRPVGVGVMGIAEALMRFHVRYGSPCAERFLAATTSEVALACWEASFDAVEYDDAPIPKGWSGERMVEIFNRRAVNTSTYDLSDEHTSRWFGLIDRVRLGKAATNTTVTSVAPTGSISLIAGWQMSRSVSNGHAEHRVVSSGIEPPFSWMTFRQDNSGETVVTHDLWTTREHRNRPWMKTAGELSATEHVRMQGAACAFVCNSVAKTINLPESATVDDMKRGYRLAWKLGVPGTALYRDRSKPMQVLTALECPSGECTVEFEVTPDDGRDGFSRETTEERRASKTAAE